MRKISLPKQVQNKHCFVLAFSDLIPSVWSFKNFLQVSLIFFRDATEEPVPEALSKKRQRDTDDGDTLPPKKAKKKKKHVDVDETRTEHDETRCDENRAKNTFAAESSKKDKFVVDKRPETDAGQPDETKTMLKRKKKKKKKKTVVEGVASVKPTSSVVQTVDVGDKNAKQAKHKKKNSKKLPPISEDRLKAYGISVKKFKYVHSKKLMAE